MNKNLTKTGTKENEKLQRNLKIDTILRTTPSLKIDDLKEEGLKAYEEKVAKENKLIEAYNNKKLKSRKLIKQARHIINFREKEKENTSTKTIT